MDSAMDERLPGRDVSPGPLAWPREHREARPVYWWLDDRAAPGAMTHADSRFKT
jgi:hypothetical protein